MIIGITVTANTAASCNKSHYFDFVVEDFWITISHFKQY